jgi:hypothetical protein
LALLAETIDQASHFVLFSWWCVNKETFRQDTMPKLDDILGGREFSVASNEDLTKISETPYFYFCNTILECVAGKKAWKIQKKQKKISKSCVTVSDEAFALLLLINSWNKFEFIADHPQCEARGELPSTLYTEKKGRNKKMRGWSQEGINNFNHLCECVVKDRQSESGKRFETSFLKYHTNEQLRVKAGIGASDDYDSDTEQMENSAPQNKAFNQLKDMCEQQSDDEDDSECEFGNKEAV